MNNEYNFEKLSDSVKVCVSSDHTFGTDAFLLTEFSGFKGNDIICDLGTGCGIIPLAISVQKPGVPIFAVDIQPKAIEQLKNGIRESNLENITPILADLKELPPEMPFHKFSLVICNPPYKASKAGVESLSEAQRIARHEVMCNINDICLVADRLLKFGGKLCICNRPERLADVISSMKQNHIEPKKLQFIAKDNNSAPWLFLIEGKKGAKPFLQVLPNRIIKSGTFFFNIPKVSSD